MSESLTTAHQEWDKRWSQEADRANWLRPEDAVKATYARLAKDGAPLNVADVGCGIGRHSLWYASQGAKVIACDGSPQGLQFGREAANKEGLSQQITWHETPFDSIPCLNHSCDLILAWNVIYHGDYSDLKRCLMEMHRAVKVGGFIQLTLLSKRNSNFGVGSEVAPDTWINDSNPEKNHPHCYVSAAQITELFGDHFELFSCIDHEHKYPGSRSWHWEIVAEAR